MTVPPSRATYAHFKENLERNFDSDIARAERSCAQQQQRQAMAERERQRLAAVYSGEAGVYGDLVRVTVHGGSMEFRNVRWPYQPTSFLIASGEIKHVRFVSANGRRTIHARMYYTNGNLQFDSGRGSRRFVYGPTWRRGKIYRNVTLNKYTATDAQNISIRVKILNPRRYRNRYRYIIIVPDDHHRGDRHYRH